MNLYPFKFKLGDEVEVITTPVPACLREGWEEGAESMISTRSGKVVALELSAKGTTASIESNKNGERKLFRELEGNLRPKGSGRRLVFAGRS